MKNVNEILERQSAHLNFEDGKVKYFSISTQHSEADTIEEAIQNIVKADECLDGKSWLRYAVDKYEEEHPLPENISPEEFSEENVERAIDFLRKVCEKIFTLALI
jgi:hypothetical protein